MAGSLNRATLIGHVGKEVEVRSTQGGREVGSFSLATSESWKDKGTGERKEKTEWHRCVVFNENLIGVLKNYVKKGSKLLVEGQIKTRKWTDSNDGTERYVTEIVLQGFDSRIILLDSKGGDAGDTDGQRKTPEPASDPLEEDLIPF